MDATNIAYHTKSQAHGFGICNIYSDPVQKRQEDTSTVSYPLTYPRPIPVVLLYTSWLCRTKYTNSKGTDTAYRGSTSQVLLAPHPRLAALQDWSVHLDVQPCAPAVISWRLVIPERYMHPGALEPYI